MNHKVNDNNEELKELIRMLQGGLTDVNRTVGSLLSDIKMLHNNVASFDSKLGSFDSKLGSFDSKFASFESKLGSFDGKFASFESKLKGMEEDIQEIRETNNLKSFADIAKRHLRGHETYGELSPGEYTSKMYSGTTWMRGNSLSSFNQD